MDIVKYILSSVFAGIAISIGCIVYLTSGLAWAFPIGLFIVCTFGLNLFTGKVCFSKLKDAPYLAVCIIFNEIAAFSTGYIFSFCKTPLMKVAKGLVSVKYNSGYFNLIILAILCNVLIFVAVGTYFSENLLSIVRLFGLYFSTVIFVLCGFEHCVANAFYFGLAREISLHSVIYLILNIIFNAVGGVFSYRIIGFIHSNDDVVDNDLKEIKNNTK